MRFFRPIDVPPLWIALAVVPVMGACGSHGPEHPTERHRGISLLAPQEPPKPQEHHPLPIGLDGKVGGAVTIDISPMELAAFPALPARFESHDNPITDAKVELGRLLYHDPRLSKSQTISCNTCHNLKTAGVDLKATSPGHKGQLGTRNSPTVFNAGAHIAQFWDGRSPTLEEQAKGPVLNPVEMAMTDEAAVVALLKSIPGYVEKFAAAFPLPPAPAAPSAPEGEAGSEGAAAPEAPPAPDPAEAITYDHMAKAIGAFERLLSTPTSRWDRFLSGDKAALTEAEKHGFKVFGQLGCVTCHAGAALGGTQFRKLGEVKPYPGLKDAGRFDATGNEADRGFFKVPTLRNVTRTAPYFHDGSIATLEEAVVLMARHQLGKEASAAEVKAVVAWLKTLEADPPAQLLETPALPPSGPHTPGPVFD